MTKKRIGALILAAGLSSRMGRFKPLLQLGGATLIERVISLFAAAGVKEIVTVAGHEADALIRVVEPGPSRLVINDNYRNGMFSSIQRGAAALMGRCDGFFLLPVDIPLVSPDTIRTLLKSFEEVPDVPVYYPQYQSRKGHPPLIDSSLIGGIADYSGDEGMRGFLKSFETQAKVVIVDDPFILTDADIPEDFLLMQQELSRRSPGK